MAIPGEESARIARRLDEATVAAVDEGARTQAVPSQSPARGPERTSKRGVITAFVLSFGSSMGTLVVPLVALPVLVANLDPQGKEFALGVSLGLLAFTQMVFAPVFGAISDRTTSRLGMRKPGLIIGGAINIASLVLLGFATSLVWVYIGVVALGVGSAVFTASFSAIIPDQVADRTRGRVLGFQSLFLVLAGATTVIIAPMFLGNQLLLFTFGTPFLAVAVLVSLFVLRDRTLTKGEAVQQPIVETILSGYRFNPRSAPDFGWVWLGRFFVTLGVSFGTGFALYFLTDQLSLTQEQLAPILAFNGLLGLAGTVAGTLAGSFLADRARSRRNMVLLSALILAAGGVVTAFAPNTTVFYIGSAIIAFGVGTFLPTDGALVMAVLPGGNHEVSKYMSIITIADQFPRAVGPLIAPAVIALGALTPLGGYPLLYLAAGLTAIVGGLLVRRIRSVR